ncbi:MAG: hypothetical protein QW282_05970 [Nitrososphaerales archaeon]
MDLFAVKGGERLVVQVKVSGRLSKEGRGELLRWAQKFGAKPILARRSRVDGYLKRSAHLLTES